MNVDAAEAARSVPARTEQARKAQARWATRDVKERARFVKRARKELIKDRKRILGALSDETGKARFDVVGELMGLCLQIGYLCKRAPAWLADEPVSTAPLLGKRGLVVFKPRGVVAVIAPWNAPLILALDDAVTALIAGNAVIVKPSEVTPAAVRVAVAAMNRALPEGVLQVVEGAGDVGAALVDHVDLVAATGSSETGRRIMRRASERLTPVLLELGGKDPMIVLSDADLERAARGAAWGSCMMTGQTCTSVERIYVERGVADRFVDKLVSRMHTLRHRTDFGPFIGPGQAAIVKEHIDDAVAKGATLRAGGAAGEPTVIADVDHSMTIMTEETFGPVVAVMAVRDADEALRLANDCSYGLSASVWTRNIDRGIALARRIDSGAACVNECVLNPGVPELPFGGVKQSGVGFRHGGAEGLRQFCVRQAILVEPRRRKSEPAWFPYSDFRAAAMERLMAMMFGI